MNSNALYLLLGLAIAAAVGLGYLLFEERQKTSGVEIEMGKGGVSVESK